MRGGELPKLAQSARPREGWCLVWPARLHDGHSLYVTLVCCVRRSSPDGQIGRSRHRSQRLTGWRGSSVRCAIDCLAASISFHCASISCHCSLRERCTAACRLVRAPINSSLIVNPMSTPKLTKRVTTRMIKPKVSMLPSLSTAPAKSDFSLSAVVWWVGVGPMRDVGGLERCWCCRLFVGC